MKDLLESLKDSLLLTLVHFYPLAGHLAIKVDEDWHECLIYLDCNKGLGPRFIHAYLQMSMSDILSPTEVPLVIQSLFDHHGAINYNAHTRPLLSVQVTELLDGIFIGSPRFDIYKNEFGLGRPVGVRTSYANKYSGYVTTFPRSEGGRSMELEICLPPNSMRALELDAEFMAVVSG
ncbi:hypothetical protein Cgig2_023331 [Carnegiea gigantea]|uniref:Uncharacterized protein n=1 Tax=Carnegiea gigantea TaxID=171969 RepID=A0A9Q1K3V5_9CARY|nr:hypothetical protein Cgig2_023331 [Carnegiea gigantea]